MAKKRTSSQTTDAKTLRQRAETLLRAKSADMPTMPTADVQALVQELNVHQIELEIQNEELRQSQLELAHSRDRYSDLYDFAPVGYVTLDKDGRILEANLTAATFLGVERKSLIGANLSTWIDHDAQDDFFLHRRSAFSDNARQISNVTMHKSDGTPTVVRLESIAQETGHQRQCRTALIDVTQQQAAQSALRDLTETLEQKVVEQTHEVQLLAAAVSHLAEGIVITDDELGWPGPRIRFVNEAMCRITGYTADELIGQTPRVLQGEQTDRGTRGRMKRELAAGRPVLCELINYRKDGTPYDAELYITPLLNSEGHRTNFVSIHRDITERKRAENLLRQERNRAQQYLDVIGVIMVGLDSHGDITLINRKGCEVLGCDEHELLGKNWFDTCLPEGSRNDVRSIFHQIMNGTLTNVEYFENSVLTRTGEERMIEWHNSEIRDENGRVVGALGSGNDITVRRQAETALRDREERMRAILNTAADAIITIDRRGIITAVNRATKQMFGYTHDELVGQNVKILMPPPYHDEHDGYIQHYLETAEARIIGIGREVVGRRKDGSTFPVDLAVSEVTEQGLFTGIVRDISERQKLQREVLGIAEDEQRRIGQDLHDSVQQELAGLGMLAQTLLENLSRETDTPDAPQASRLRELAQKVVNGIARTHQDVQAIARGLVPVRIDTQGLMDALRELALRTDDVAGVTCAFKCEQPVEMADNSINTHLYRIAQEAITNALKHGRPEHLLIALESDNDQPVLQIADDGTGFNATEQTEGLGLKTMHYRASLIGASLKVSPVETGGTLVTCRVFRGGG